MKIALLTPYTGGNLGDAAIQEAVIRNARERFPNASLCLVTMRPELTSPLHTLPSYGISRFAPWQADAAAPVAADESDASPRSTAVKRGLASRLKEAIKASHRIYSVLNNARDRWSLLSDEVEHIRRVYGLLKDVDLLIVSGGGQLDEFWGGAWEHPYALFKWGTLAKMVGCKFVVLSVGTGELESKMSAFFIRRALAVASYRSYRDQTSKELLKHIAFTRDDRVYPDLAFSYSSTEAIKSLEKMRYGKVIGVSPICYLSPHGWPKQNAAVYERYFDVLLDFIRTSTKRGYSVVLFSSAAADEKIAFEIISTLAKEDDLDVIGGVRHVPTRTLTELFDQLRRVDFVVASRLHGILLSHRLCLPVLAISYDRKVHTYMSDVGMSQYCVDIHELGTNSLQEVFEIMIQKSESIRSVLSAVNERYARDLQRQYDAVLK